MSEVRLIDANALKANLPEPTTIKQDWVYRTLCDFIDNAPTVTPPLPTEVKKALEVLKIMKQGKWIPVSEKLPPNFIRCLFCDADGDIYCGYRNSKNDWYDEYLIENVVAWQELPKPYEERPNCVTCDHFGKCEGCEKGDEE